MTNKTGRQIGKIKLMREIDQQKWNVYNLKG